MGWFETVAYSLLAHPYWLSFLAGSVNEEIVIFLSFLAGQGLISFWTVFLLGLLGQIVFDNLLFIFVRSQRGRLIEKRAEKKEGKFIKFFKKFGKNNPFWIIISSKFIYGIRTLAILYVGAHKISWKKFFLYDTIAALLLVSVMAPLGWLAGRGFSHWLTVVSGTEKLIGEVLLVFIIIYFVHRTISERFFNKK